MAFELTRRDAIAALSLPLLPALGTADEKPAPANAFTLVVMDPLAAELSCPCVKGYAQRDYNKLGAFISSKIGRPVAVHFAESLAGALTKKTSGKADLIIGKDSVVRAEAAGQKLTVSPVASLSGKDGKTTQTGLICVAKNDKALTAGDLTGYRIVFGPAEAEEKHGAALKVLKELGVAVTGKLETCHSCTDGATAAIEAAKGGEKVATVISSYAQPLLEGCGTIKKGDLRVVGETDPVPFIVAFATSSLAAAELSVVKAALLAVGANKDLCTALETKDGFVEQPDGSKKK